MANNILCLVRGINNQPRVSPQIYHVIKLLTRNCSKFRHHYCDHDDDHYHHQLIVVIVMLVIMIIISIIFMVVVVYHQHHHHQLADWALIVVDISGRKSHVRRTSQLIKNVPSYLHVLTDRCNEKNVGLTSRASTCTCPMHSGGQNS